jgi:hypothetical protein
LAHRITGIWLEMRGTREFPEVAPISRQGGLVPANLPAKIVYNGLWEVQGLRIAREIQQFSA